MEIAIPTKRKFHKDSWRRWIPRVRKNKSILYKDTKKIVATLS